MEKSISIPPSQLKNLGASILKYYGHVYLGSEFCENQLPTKSEVLFLSKIYKGNIVLTTPILSEKGIIKVKSLINSLPKGLIKEVVVNDWGLLRFLNEKHPEISPILGRLIMHEVFPINKDFLNNFCREYNIGSVEIDNPEIISELKMFSGKINFNYPFQFRSVTRFCPYMKKFNSEKCHRFCDRIGAMKLRNKKVYSKDIVLFSTAYFIYNNTIPKEAKISRIVRVILPTTS